MIKNQQVENFRNLAQIAISKGLVKNPQPSVFKLVNLAIYPYTSTKKFYEDLTQTTRVWQKLTFAASQDVNFLQRITKQMAYTDPWGNFLSKIYNGYSNKNKNTLIYQRYDWITDQNLIPKIIQYNFIAVGSAVFTKIIQQSHKIYYPMQSKLFLGAKACDIFIDTIYQHYKIRNLKGKLVIMIGNREGLFFTQLRYFQSRLVSYGIVVQRVKLAQFGSLARVDNNQDLYHNQQLVSFILFRHGFNLNHYQQISIENRVKLKTMIANSNATSIPNIQYEVVNTKRAQTELSKPQMMRNYLTEEQAKILEASVIQCGQFYHMKQSQFQLFVQKVKENPQNWVLKPNREAGNNNIFGNKIIEFLSQKTVEQMKEYIYQRKINSGLYENYIISEQCKLSKAKCFYQLGTYGVVSVIDENPKLNYDCGYVASTHNISVNQTSPSAVGAIDGFTSWKIVQN